MPEAVRAGAAPAPQSLGRRGFCATSTGARTGQPIHDPNEFAVTRIEVTSDGGIAFWSREDRRIVIWDRREGRQLASKRFFAPIDAIGVGPDGRPTVTVDGTTWVWHADVGRLQPDRAGRDDHTAIPVATLTALAPGGRVAAVADPHEPRIRLWDLDRNEGLGQPLLPPEEAESAISASGLSFAEDGRALAATYDTGAVVLWDTDPRSWAARACAIVRPLVQDWPARFLPGQELRKGCLQR
jgi:WD40 repeat protein